MVRRLPRVLGALFVALAIAATSAPARAGFSADQQKRLDRGELVVEPMEYERGKHEYVGGVSYAISTTPIERLSEIARDPKRLPELLPAVEKVEVLSISEKTGIAKIRVTHKLGPTRGSYTFLCMFHDGGLLGRFWLDPTADNALDDAWGYVRLTPLGGGRTLVTYGLLYDLGPGVIRMLFEARIRNVALEYPLRLAHAR
jgi:hypothetical protein